MLAKS
jgi:hypothetical protein